MTKTWPKLDEKWQKLKKKKKIEDIAKIKNDMQICDMGY